MSFPLPNPMALPDGFRVAFSSCWLGATHAANAASASAHANRIRITLSRTD
jgi:hypothetical protein